MEKQNQIESGRVVGQKIMTLFELIDNDNILSCLDNIVSGKKVSTAYLFHGKDGAGTEAFALEFAAKLLCGSQNNKPCGSCSSCRKMKTLQHPDLFLVYPLPSKEESRTIDPFKGLSSKKIEEIQQLLQKKSEDPYTKLLVSGARSIPISFVRWIRKQVYMKPQESSARCVIIFDAHLLTIEASNAFLKVLEEPPENTIFILTSEFPESILPTIRSRCQALFFPQLPEGRIENKLVQKGIPGEKAKLIANLSAGDLTAAYKILDYDIIEIEDMAINLLVYIATWNKNKLKEKLQNMVEIYRKDQYKFFLVLKIIQRWFMDAALLKLGMDRHLVLYNRRDRLIRFVKSFPDFDVEGLHRAIDYCVDLLRSNVYISLALVNLFFDLKEGLGRRAK